MYKHIILFCLFFSLDVRLHARERMEYYSGVRALGMGGVTVPTVNDETALIQNPAALGKLRNSFVTVVDPELDMSLDTNSVVGSEFMKGLDIQGALDKLNGNPSKYLYNRAQVFPSLVVPNFGVGFFAKYELIAQIEDTTNYQAQYVNDMAFVLGYNFRMFDGKVKLGFNGRVTNRTEFRETVPTTTTGLDLSTNAKEGIGIGTDVGLILTGPWKYLPTLAAVMRDTGHTRYDFQDGMFNSTNDTPDTVMQSLDVGLAIFPIVGKGVRSTWAIEVRDVLNMSTYEDPNRLYHWGFEFNFYDGFFLRGGMNQNYWTAGVEFAVGNYQLQLAAYGEEVGEGTQTQEDRRYVGKFAYRF